MKKNIYKLTSYFKVRKDADQYLPRLQSHRGYVDQNSRSVRENSLSSVQRAYELGYPMVEFDVRLTRDGQVILFHDDRFKNLLISQTPLSVLRSHTAVDLLSDIFDWYTQNKIKNFKFNIEIKSKVVNGRLEKAVHHLISKFDLRNQVLISSFNPISLAYFRGLDESIFRSLLLTFVREHGNNFVIRKMFLNFLAQPNALHLRDIDWKTGRFQEMLNKKIPIILWTCNDIADVQEYFKQGITGVISDVITPADLKNLKQ